jgi:hypothetical protein
LPTVAVIDILAGNRIVRVESSLKVEDMTSRPEAKAKVWPRTSSDPGLERPPDDEQGICSEFWF